MKLTKVLFQYFILQILKHSISAMTIKILLNEDPKGIISERINRFSV